MKGKMNTAPKGTNLELSKNAGRIKLKTTIRERVINIPIKTARYCLFSIPLAINIFFINKIMPVRLKPTTTIPNKKIPGPFVILVIWPVREISVTFEKTIGVNVSIEVNKDKGKSVNLYKLENCAFSLGKTKSNCITKKANQTEKNITNFRIQNAVAGVLI